MWRVVLAWIFICVSILSAASAEREILFAENFDAIADTPWGTLPADWWLEGEAGGARARIADGRLWLDANGRTIPGATLWLDRVFTGDVEVTFDVHVVASEGDANNMNLFFLFRDPERPDLRATCAERDDARYAKYHSEKLGGVLLTFLANGEPERARVRLRQVPPFEPVVHQFNGHHARVGTTYRVTMARRGARVTCRIDDLVVADLMLPRAEAAMQPGYLGFRTWRTELWWDNIVVRRPVPVE